MPREKALPACAEPDCDKDAVMKGRHCVLHVPRAEPEPCDALISDKETKELCGVIEGTIAFTPAWVMRPPGRLVRCPRHRETEYLRIEFGQEGAV